MPAGPWEQFWEPDEPAGPVPRRTHPERKLSVTVGPADLSGRPIEAYRSEGRTRRARLPCMLPVPDD
jgi:hypothetical protein